MTSSLIDRLNAVSEQVALKRPVRVASTSNLTLSGFQTIDGVAPAPNDDNLIAEENKQAGRKEATDDVTRKTAETENKMRDVGRPDDESVARSLQDGHF